MGTAPRYPKTISESAVSRISDAGGEMTKYQVTFEIDAHGTRVDEIIEATTDWRAVLIAQQKRRDEGKAGYVVDCQEMA